MTRPLRLLPGAVLAAAAFLGLAALSQLPYRQDAGDRAILRLSWRTRSASVHECRTLSAEEQAALPIHMRREEVCEGRVLPYHLRVELDGRALVDDTIHPAGAREDRPLYVFREIPIDPGEHRLRVRFRREEGGAAVRPSGERREEHAAATPARLDLGETLRLEPGEVALITYDADRRALVARLPAPLARTPHR